MCGELFAGWIDDYIWYGSAWKCTIFGSGTTDLDVTRISIVTRTHLVVRRFTHAITWTGNVVQRFCGLFAAQSLQYLIASPDSVSCICMHFSCRRVFGWPVSSIHNRCSLQSCKVRPDATNCRWTKCVWFVTWRRSKKKISRECSSRRRYAIAIMYLFSAYEQLERPHVKALTCMVCSWKVLDGTRKLASLWSHDWKNCFQRCQSSMFG